eukprot:XP_011532320.1 uncharacterized protein C3orf84 isoform X3 [Homo sapiens]
MQSALVGSWHNNGFYGHYRSQFKSESAREYHLAAKPQPPAVFLQRCQEPAQRHFFSKHDNRTSFDKVQPSHTRTTYQQNFCCPSQGGHYGSYKVGPQAPVTDVLPDLPGIPRPKLLQHYLHAGVSECLNWSRALNKDS